MGWSIGRSSKDGRDIGYGVPSICDHPDCNKQIDRGLAYVCGMINSEGEDRGCGLHFCGSHLLLSAKYGQLCFRCWPRRREPWTRKPDLPIWICHKLCDPSWYDYCDADPEIPTLKCTIIPDSI